MSIRSFAVFQDAPAEIVLKSPVTSSSTTLSDVTSDDNGLPVSASNLLSPTLEKENLDPVTGLPTSSSQPNKKRKTSSASVLATKLCVAPTEDSGKGKKPELKHRKSSSSSIPKAKDSSTSKKKTKKDRERKVLGHSGNTMASITSSRDISAMNSRRALHIVHEHEDGDAQSGSGVQAVINSRCYDLTVLPLADVSTAYLQSTGVKAAQKPHADADEQIAEVLLVKDTSFEAQMRDYFSPSQSKSSLPSSSRRSLSRSHSMGPSQHSPGFTIYRDTSQPSTPSKTAGTNRARETSVEEEEEVRATLLSTPERKQIYAAFTFSSPIRSPSV